MLVSPDRLYEFGRSFQTEAIQQVRSRKQVDDGRANWKFLPEKVALWIQPVNLNEAVEIFEIHDDDLVLQRHGDQQDATWGAQVRVKTWNMSGVDLSVEL